MGGKTYHYEWAIIVLVRVTSSNGWPFPCLLCLRANQPSFLPGTRKGAREIRRRHPGIGSPSPCLLLGRGQEHGINLPERVYAWVGAAQSPNQAPED